MFYKVSLTEELSSVKRAIDYYVEWATEFQSRDRAQNDDFMNYYYRGFDLSKTTTFRFRALFFAMRLQPLLTYIKHFTLDNKRAPYILDLGCGFGLESLLSCLMGARVDGVDPWHYMIDHAEKNQESYQKRHHVQLDLNYKKNNVFTLDCPERYDAVYSSATLHHIEPVGEAIQAIAQLLKPGGVFFLSDENGYSPVQQLIVQKRIGWTKPRKFPRVDPETGEAYIYGNENIRPPSRWAVHLRRAKLIPQTIKYCRYLPPVNWSVERLVKTERRLRCVPFLAQLGAIGFMFIAQKPDADQ